MLYAILDNGDFKGLVSGPENAPVLEYMREFGEASPAFVEHLIVDKGFERVLYNLSDDTPDSNPKQSPPPSNEHELYVILTDDSLWTVVRGTPGIDMAALIAELEELEEHGGLDEFLQTRGFSCVTIEPVDGIDALGPMAYAQGGFKVAHKIFLN